MASKDTGFHPSDPDWTRGRSQAVADAESIARRQIGLTRRVTLTETPDPAVDDPECTDCGGTGITYQTERRCACQPAPHVNETPKTEHHAGNMLTDAITQKDRTDG